MLLYSHRIGADRFVKTLQILQHRAAIVMCLRIVAVSQRDCLVEACERVVETHEIVLRHAAIVEGLGIGRVQRDRFVVA